MPKPTKQDLAISAFLGGKLSPTQVRRLTTSEGLGLPPGVSWADYGPTLAPLVGKGRDLDVAAVRLAGEHGYATDRLRQVLMQPADENRALVILEALSQVAGKAAHDVVVSGTPEQADGLHETVAVRRAYQDRGEEVPEVFEKLEDQAQVITATAFLDMDDTWDGDTTAGFEDASRIFAQVAGNYNGPPEPGREDVYPDEFAYWMRQFAERLRSGPQWVAQASSSELVAAVQVATTMWHATAVHKLPLGEEDTWRMIAALANAAFSLVELVAEIQSQIMTGPCNTAGVGAHLEA